MNPTAAPSRKAVLFDLDDTLFDHQHARRAALAMLQRSHAPLAGRSIRELEVLHERHLQATFELLAVRKLDLAESRRERMRLLFADHGVELAPDSAARAEAFYRRAYDVARRAVTGVEWLIPALLQCGVKLAVVTNGFAIEQQEKLRLCGLSAAFRAVVLGGDLGLSKPDPAIFRRALAALEVGVDEAVVIGDSWSLDVQGARNAGIAAVWFNRCGDPHPEAHLEGAARVPMLTGLAPLETALSLLLSPGVRTRA